MCLKNPYKDSILESELSQLEGDIVWKNAQNAELKEKLVRDLHKLSQKDRLRRVFVLPLRLCVVAAVLVIAFVLVKQEHFRDSDASLGSTFSKSIPATFGQPLLNNKDISVSFTREEQNMIERVNGDKELFLTEEAVIPSSEVLHFLPVITGQPEIAASKEGERVLASVTYPVKGGKSLTIVTAVNRYGSAKQAYDSLVKRYSGLSTLLTIGNHKSLIIHPAEADGEQQVMVISEEYIYTISGGNSSEDVLNLAKSIQFNQ